MSPCLGVLAQVVPVEELAGDPQYSRSWPQTFVILGILSGVCLVAFLGVVYLRRPRRRRKHRLQHHRENEAAAGMQSGNSVPADGAEDRLKRRRREHRPRNPTLAETRGLPPVRDAETRPPLD